MFPTDADSCVYNTISDLLSGDYVIGEKDSSYEHLHYQTGMSQPRARIMAHPSRPLNIVVAVARFTWLISGNNRVEDIAFYEPKVRAFSDDGLTVPGSCYGARIFGYPTGTYNQIAGVIDRLATQPNSRQAAVVVWLPEDAVRESCDIPCTFGMFFHLRNRRQYIRQNDGLPDAYNTVPHLDMCTVMRSNNAFRILPFNLFEFTMLHEIVAVELGVPLGDYKHWAASMHVYDNEREMPATREIADMDGPAKSYLMPDMPYGYALLQATSMAQAEARLRHACNVHEFGTIVTAALDALNPYWRSLFQVLVAYNAAKRGWEYVPFAPPDFLTELTDTVIRKQFPNLASSSM